jgi:hypothetical protein
MWILTTDQWLIRFSISINGEKKGVQWYSTSAIYRFQESLSFSLKGSIVRQIKSRWVRWVGHVVCMRNDRKVYMILVGKPKGKRPLRRRSVNWRMGSKWILGRPAGWMWIGFTWLRIRTSGGLLGTWWWTLGFWRHGVSYKKTSNTKNKYMVIIFSLF